MGSEQHIQTPSGNLTLRTVISIREAVQLVDLQGKIWGYGRPDADLPYPARALFAISESGGHVAVASIENTPVGLSLAWTAMNRVSKKPYLHSQLNGVVKEYRSHGIGYHLKSFQRDFALDQNLSLIRWTFDPTRSVNASLNVRKLGAIVETYEPNYYGRLDSEFGRGLATDRVWAEWHIASGRVKSRLSGVLPDFMSISSAPAITRVVDEPQGIRRMVDFDLARREAALRVEIPDDFDAVSERDSSAAEDWQTKIREIFQHYLRKGYRVADFSLLEGPPRRAFYLLSSAPLEELLSS